MTRFRGVISLVIVAGFVRLGTTIAKAMKSLEETCAPSG